MSQRKVSQHTKGPWKISDNYPWVVKTDPTPEGALFIAETRPGYIGLPVSLDSPECIEANARLIAAAPELYEFLVKFCTGTIPGGWREEFEQAQALIKKIDGAT